MIHADFDRTPETHKQLFSGSEETAVPSKPLHPFSCLGEGASFLVTRRHEKNVSAKKERPKNQQKETP